MLTSEEDIYILLHSRFPTTQFHFEYWVIYWLWETHLRFFNPWHISPLFNFKMFPRIFLFLKLVYIVSRAFSPQKRNGCNCFSWFFSWFFSWCFSWFFFVIFFVIFFRDFFRGFFLDFFRDFSWFFFVIFSWFFRDFFRDVFRHFFSWFFSSFFSCFFFC